MYFTTAVNSKIDFLTLQSQKTDGHISERTAKLTKHMDVQMNSSILKPSDPITVLILLHNFKIFCYSNEIYKGAAMWLFPYFIKEPAKVPLSYRLSAAEDNTTH